jgi:hypothetical protein
MENPNIAPLVTFHATCVPLIAADHIISANAAAPRWEPTTCVIVLAISSPPVCFREFFELIAGYQ